MLARHPVITMLAVITLALGMAGNTLIFSFLNAFFLRPMPFHEPDRLVDLDETAPRWNLQYTGLAYPDFNAWRSQNRSFEGMAAWNMGSFSLSTEGGSAERIRGALVTHDLMAVLGIRPSVGRPFTAEEDRPGSEKVVLISRNLWKGLFGGQTVLGKVLRLDREPYTIIGVLPEDKTLVEGAEVWVPLAENPEVRKGWYLRGVGRLKHGVTPAMAGDDLLRVHKALIAAKKADENTSPRVTSITDRMFGDAKRVLAILMGAVGVVLLIACGNVAALMLARGLARWQEMGIRMSMGATSWRLGRLIGAECLLTSAAAGVLGLVIGYWGQHRLLDSIAERPPEWISFAFDVRIWLYSLAMVLVTAAFGAMPTWRTVIQGDPRGTLAASGRQSTTAPAKRRSLHSLVVCEVALTLILLIQAGLLVQAFRAVQKADPGYRPDRVLIYWIGLPEQQYKEMDQCQAFYASHLEQVRALPGVVSASIVTAPPLSGHWGNFFNIENAPARRPDEPDPVVLQRVAWPGYLGTMGIPVLAGRDLTEQDGQNEGSRAAIVNETFAKRFWPSQDPIGKRISHRGRNNPWMTVVGVAKDIKHYGMDRPMIPGVYIPYVQDKQRGMNVVVRTAGEPLDLVSTVRDLVRQADPDLPVSDVRSMAGQLERSLWLRRLYSSLIGIFAAVALVMAVGGLYGVFSYVVGGRTREIGVRIALGAEQRRVLWMVLRQGLILTTIGVGIGLLGAVLVVNLMHSMLVGVRPADLWTCAVIPVALVAVALLACYVPARRAAKVDPMEALRCE